MPKVKVEISTMRKECYSPRKKRKDKSFELFFSN